MSSRPGVHSVSAIEREAVVPSPANRSEISDDAASLVAQVHLSGLGVRGVWVVGEEDLLVPSTTRTVVSG